MVWVFAAVGFLGAAVWMHRFVARASDMDPEDLRARAEERGLSDDALADFEKAVQRFQRWRWLMAANAILATALAVSELTG